MELMLIVLMEGVLLLLSVAVRLLMTLMALMLGCKSTKTNVNINHAFQTFVSSISTRIDSILSLSVREAHLSLVGLLMALLLLLLLLLVLLLLHHERRVVECRLGMRGRVGVVEGGVGAYSRHS